jgi:hypothetical protein
MISVGLLSFQRAVKGRGVVFLLYVSFALFIVGAGLSMRGKHGATDPFAGRVGIIALVLFMIAAVWIAIQKLVRN